jgi:hypothetical protein
MTGGVPGLMLVAVATVANAALVPWRLLPSAVQVGDWLKCCSEFQWRTTLFDIRVSRRLPNYADDFVFDRASS